MMSIKQQLKQQAGPGFHTKVAVDINQHGVSIVGIASSMPFYYTIGRHGLGFPELLLIGPFHHENAYDWLNKLHLILAHRAAIHGEPVSIGGTFSPKLLNVIEQLPRVRADYTPRIGEFYRTAEYKVQQVLIPDRSGRFPPDPLCQAPINRQPIFGELS